MPIGADSVIALIGVAFIAGIVDAIGGGGGLLTLPALLLAGLDPVAALATSKVQSSAGSISATLAFARRKIIDWRLCALFCATAGLAGLLGALSVSLAPTRTLATLAPLLLLAIALYFATASRISDEDRAASMSVRAFAVTLIPLIGFYDGLFGPGAGAFYMICIVRLLGFGLTRATGYTKAVNAASNLGGLACFAVMGAPLWPLGLSMAVAALVGAQIGAHLAMRFGARLIRPLIITASVLMALRLLAR